MKTIDIFYQGEGITALEHIEIGDHESFGTLCALIGEKHGLVHCGDGVGRRYGCPAKVRGAGAYRRPISRTGRPTPAGGDQLHP